MQSLDYPFATPPEPGQTRQVATGVHWLRMPIDSPLDHINLYLLEAPHGWWIIDTGVHSPQVREHWRRLIGSWRKPLLGIIVTHMHPDHVGQAGWLTREYQVPLYMTRGEYLQAWALGAALSSDDLAATTHQYYRRAGMADRQIEAIHQRARKIGDWWAPLPCAYRRLQEGDRLRIGTRSWQIRIGQGHSLEHACLYCEQDKMLISGDQVLPKITPNVSLGPMEPEANPLALWLDSLRELLKLPADTLVLPAHNMPFRGLHERLNYLLQHHEACMGDLLEACRTPRTAMELVPRMFRRKLDLPQLSMALGECLAHLQLLLSRGHMERHLDEQGVFRYQAISARGLQQADGPQLERLDQPVRA